MALDGVDSKDNFRIHGVIKPVSEWGRTLDGRCWRGDLAREPPKQEALKGNPHIQHDFECAAYLVFQRYLPSSYSSYKRTRSYNIVSKAQPSRQ